MDGKQSTEFSQRLVTLAEVFNQKMSPQRQALYFEALRDLPFEAVVRAMNTSVRTSKFLPLPAELRALVVGDTEDQAEQAWISMRASMKSLGSYSSAVFDDAALGETVVAMFGTWAAACVAEFTPEMWASKRKEFGRIYRVMRNRNLDGPRYLPGLCEGHNNAREEWKRFTPLGRIGRDGDVRQLTGADAEQARTLIAANAHQFSAMRTLAGGAIDDIEASTAKESA